LPISSESNSRPQLTIESVDRKGMLNNSGGRVRDVEVFATVKDRREEARRMI
jgi:hypothetical protein